MRRNRILWGGLWILSLVGISLFSGPVSYGFFAMVTILPIVSIVYLLCVNTCFHIYQRLDGNRPVAGQNVPFFFTLMNEYFFTFSGISVKFFSSFSTINGLSDEVEYELLPHTGIEKETSLICKYRGEYEVGIKTVVSQDFLRLFRLSYHNRETLRVLVRPRLVYLEELKGIEESLLLQDTQPMQADQPDVLTREYVPGDDIRLLHFPLTAKTGTLWVRQRTGDKEQGVGILMSTERRSDDPKDYLAAENKVLECTLALTLFFVRRQIPVQHLHWAGAPVGRSLSGMEAFTEYYDLLSAAEFDRAYREELLWTQAAGQEQLLRQRAVCMVLQDLTEAAVELIGWFCKNQVYVLVYLIGGTLQEDLLKLPRVRLTVVMPEDEPAEVM